MVVIDGSDRIVGELVNPEHAIFIKVVFAREERETSLFERFFATVLHNVGTESVRDVLSKAAAGASTVVFVFATQTESVEARILSKEHLAIVRDRSARALVFGRTREVFNKLVEEVLSTTIFRREGSVVAPSKEGVTSRIGKVFRGEMSVTEGSVVGVDGVADLGDAGQMSDSKAHVDTRNDDIDSAVREGTSKLGSSPKRAKVVRTGEGKFTARAREAPHLHGFGTTSAVGRVDGHFNTSSGKDI